MFQKKLNKIFYLVNGIAANIIIFIAMYKLIVLRNIYPWQDLAWLVAFMFFGAIMLQFVVLERKIDKLKDREVEL